MGSLTMPSWARICEPATLGADYSKVRTESSATGYGLSPERAMRRLWVSGALPTVESSWRRFQADKFDGGNVNLDVNTDSSGIRSLSSNFKGLASNIRATGTVLKAAAIPLLSLASGQAFPL